MDLFSRIVSSPGTRLGWDLFIKIHPQNTGPKKPDRKENVLYDSFYIKCKHRQNQSVLGGVGIFAGAGTGGGDAQSPRGRRARHILCLRPDDGDMGTFSV